MKRGRLLVNLAQRKYQICEAIQVNHPSSPPAAEVKPTSPSETSEYKETEKGNSQSPSLLQNIEKDNTSEVELNTAEYKETEKENSQTPSLLQNIEKFNTSEVEPNSPSGDFTASDTDDDYQPAAANIDSSTDSDVSAPIPDNTDIERRSRKRIRNEKNWAKNKKKVLVNTGQAYVTVTGRERRAKRMGMSCGEKCKLKCSSTFTEHERQLIFANFYKTGDRSRQRDFLSKCMEIIKPRKYRREEATRKLNYAYYFYHNNSKKRVCKLFFKNTLDINNSVITTVQNMTNNEGFTQKEGRGTHSQHKCLPGTAKQSVRDHINSFPRVESHYCRADNRREFLEGDLTISTMYRLYIEYCEKNELEPVKNSMYAHIFNTEFNISFFKPKKDQCSKCEAFKNASPEAKLDLQVGYDKHIAEKNLSRVIKRRDIDRAKSSNDSISIFDYDLQAVAPLPQGEVSTFYYKSKLNFINFTVCNCVNKDGLCFAWHEGIAKRGANEIGSCIYSLLEELGHKSEVIFYSDNCGGQNKNKFILSMYMYAVQKLPIDVITHNYLIAGHTQNDADNLHSVIEREKRRLLKSGPIFTPAQMIMVLKSAKKTGKLYTVHEKSYDEIYNWKKLSQNIGKNFNVDENGQKIAWGEIKCIQIKIENPYTFAYKTSFSDDDFTIVNIRRKQRSRIQENITLEKAYFEPPTISDHKKRDLMSLCTANLIPQSYHSFFESLPCSSKQENERDSDSETA